MVSPLRITVPDPTIAKPVIFRKCYANQFTISGTESPVDRSIFSGLRWRPYGAKGRAAMLDFKKIVAEEIQLSEPQIMEGFPPPNEGQVTLANWRLPPFNRWAYQHVRELLPTSTIHRTERPVDRLMLVSSLLDRLAFQGPDG